MNNRIGIVGGGQLGRMMTEPAQKLGFEVTVLDPTPNCPAAQVGAKQIVGAYNDESGIRELAKQSDFLTFEIELAHAELLDELASGGLKVNPSATTLGIIKDKLNQKTYLREQGLPVADFKAVTNQQEIEAAAEEFGLPMLLKARFDAYDGRGNALVESLDQIPAALEKLGDRELYVEKFVDFERELAVMVARGMDGDIKTFPVVETVHQDNILHLVRAPAPIEPTATQAAEQFARDLMEHLGGAGVYGIELFETKDGQILINEIAPRVHNSGHYTIEACATSQFEQQIRAITGMPLESTEMNTPAAVMINILGDRHGPADPKGLDKAQEIPGVSVHIYGKAETKPQRKMGHLTAIAEALKGAEQNALKARECISI